MSEPRDVERMLEAAEQAAAADDFAAADQLLRDAARLQEEALGPLHPDLANTLNNLAVVAERRDRPDDAEAFYRRAVAIAAASLPPDHPMVAASKKNLEDFCGTRIAVEPAPVVAPEPPPVSPAPVSPEPIVSPQPAVPSEPVVSRPAPRSLMWPAALGAIVVLVAIVLLTRRSPAPVDTPAPAPTAERAAPPPAAEPAPPSRAEPAVPAPVVSPPPPPPVEKKPATPPASGAITLPTAELCRGFSPSGTRWRCDPAGNPVAPGPLVLYTRVTSPDNTTVVHRWYRGDTLRQSVKLTIRPNGTDGYRTYSRQTVNGGAAWRVEVRSADGALLHERRFTVR